MKRLTTLRIVVLLATLVLLVGLNPAAARKVNLSGNMSGNFLAGGEFIPGLLFYVVEEAEGDIDEGSEYLEDPHFSYAGFFIYDMAVLPDPLPLGCDPGSSSSDYGHGIMFFGEGNLRLEMKSAFSCFSYPNININASYKIVGGTGLFEHAKGFLEVTVDGTIGDPNTMTTEFEGEVRLASDDDDQ